jgi:hypothetical protein
VTNKYKKVLDKQKALRYNIKVAVEKEQMNLDNKTVYSNPERF